MAPRAGFLFFAGLLVVNLTYHQMWGDELQAWGIARASSDLAELYQNLRGEGHPMLWHAVLWPAARLTGDPLALQALHAGLTLAWLALLWFRSPFSPLEKTLLSLGQYLVFDYAVVSRCYGLGVLLVFGFVAFREGLARRPWSGWLVLGLLANTHLFLALAAVALGALWVWMERARGRNVLSGVSLFVLLGALALVTLMRGDASNMQTGGWYLGFSPSRLVQKFDSFCDAFAPLEDPRRLRYWKPGMTQVPSLIAGGLVLGLIFRYLWGQWAGLAAFLGLVASMTACFYLRYGGHFWHNGVMVVTLVAVVWMLRADGRKLGPPLAFLAILALNAAGGVKAVIASKARPVSTSREAARWIEDQGLQDEPWIAYPSFPCFVVGAYLDKSMYFPDTGTEARYSRWSEQELVRVWDLPADLEALFARKGIERAYLVTYWDLLNGPWKPPHRIDEVFHLVELARFRNAEEDRERFILYRLERRP